MELLGSTDIKIWELAIQNVYIKGSSGYKRLLSRFKRPFQQGSQESKITAVIVLDKRLEDEPDLTALKVLVSAKLFKLNSFNSSKNTGKSTLKIKSNEVETARIDLADELYGTLGALMKYFRKNPKFIKTFFMSRQSENLSKLSGAGSSRRLFLNIFLRVRY